jgi:5-methylcytosine-specific restriction protein A
MVINQEIFIVNAKGEKIGVILSLKHYQQLLGDLHDLAAVSEGRQEEMNPLEEVKRRKMTKQTPKSVDFQNALEQIFHAAQQQELSAVEVISGELHRRVGGYPSNNHRMPICCHVMRTNMHPGD